MIRIMRKPNVIPFKMIKGEIHVETHYMKTCTGCYESNEGHVPRGTPIDKKWGIPIGMGCHECHYKGKIRVFDWVPVWKSGRKTCFSCKHLEWYEGEGGESLDQSGWTCDKRQAPMDQYKESEFSSLLQSTEYKIRFKNCFEQREDHAAR